MTGATMLAVLEADLEWKGVHQTLLSSAQCGGWAVASQRLVNFQKTGEKWPVQGPL